MQVYLPAPGHEPGGPDGKGWNRLSIGSMAGDECALKPRSYPALWEVRNGRTGTYGAYGPCPAKGACEGCPVISGEPRRLHAFTRRVMVRLMPGQLMDSPHLMNHPERGWESSSREWTWQELARVPDWQPGDRFRDEHSAGFWLEYVGGGEPWEHKQHVQEVA